MIGILLRTAIIGLGIWVAAWLIPGISTESTGALIWGAIALGLINAFVRPILVVLTLPVTVLTLGLFLLVLNAAMLKIRQVVPGAAALAERLRAETGLESISVRLFHGRRSRGRACLRQLRDSGGL